PALRLPGLRFQPGARLRAVRAHLAAEAAGPLVGAQGLFDAAVELAVDLVVVQEQLPQPQLEFHHLGTPVAASQHRSGGLAFVPVLVPRRGLSGGGGRRARGRFRLRRGRARRRVGGRRFRGGRRGRGARAVGRGGGGRGARRRCRGRTGRRRRRG